MSFAIKRRQVKQQVQFSQSIRFLILTKLIPTEIKDSWVWKQLCDLEPLVSYLHKQTQLP